MAVSLFKRNNLILLIAVPSLVTRTKLNPVLHKMIDHGMLDIDSIPEFITSITSKSTASILNLVRRQGREVVVRAANTEEAPLLPSSVAFSKAVKI